MYLHLKKIRFVFLPILLYLLSGCVYYTFQGGSLSKLKTVDVKPVVNNTLQYGLESTVESSLKSGFVKDGRLSVTNEKGDIEVTTVVKEFKKDPYDYNSSGDVKNYKISLSLYVKITGKGLEKPIYDGNISDWLTENATGFDLEKAKTDISEKLSDDIIDKIFSYW